MIEFNENRSWSLVEYRNYSNPPSGKPDRSALRFVYDDGNGVKGYIYAVECPYEPSPFEAKVTIYDSAFDLDYTQAFIILMKYLLRESYRRNAQRVIASFPFDPLIQKLLVSASFYFSWQEIQSGIASNMMCIIDLKGILKTITYELTCRRMNAIKCNAFTLRIKVDDHTAILKFGESSVEVVDNVESDIYLNCDTLAFLMWLIGLNGFNEWQIEVASNLNQTQKKVLSTLFLRQPCASGPWG